MDLDLHTPRKRSDDPPFILVGMWSSCVSYPPSLLPQITKYGILCRGLRALIAAHNIEPDHACIWMDYSCIDQDDKEKKEAGISSLIAYAAKSDYVLIPVFPNPKSARAFNVATHPAHLHNYGERAWCRLETYVFLCLAEITRKDLNCYGMSYYADCNARVTKNTCMNGECTSE